MFPTRFALALAVSGVVGLLSAARGSADEGKGKKEDKMPTIQVTGLFSKRSGNTGRST